MENVFERLVEDTIGHSIRLIRTLISSHSAIRLIKKPKLTRVPKNERIVLCDGVC